MSEASLAPGKRLSQIRQQLGLSQRRVAELSGLTHSAISTIEQDKVSLAISTLQKLLKVYGLSLSEFFAEPEAADEPRVVIDAEDLIEIGSRGVDEAGAQRQPDAQPAMMLETYQPGTTTGEKIKHPGRRDRHPAGRRDRADHQRPELLPDRRSELRHQHRHSAQLQQYVGAHLPHRQRTHPTTF